MSVTPIFSVWCDNCSDWVAQCSTRKEARAEAKAKGWSCVRTAVGKVDLCPACTEQDKKSQEKTYEQ